MESTRTVTVEVTKKEMEEYIPSYKYKDLGIDMCLELGPKAIELLKKQGDEIARHTLSRMLKDKEIGWDDVWDYNVETDVDSVENVFRIHGSIGVKLGKGDIDESCKDYAHDLETEYVYTLRERLLMITDLNYDFKNKTGADLLTHEQMKMLQTIIDDAKELTIKVEIE